MYYSTSVGPDVHARSIKSAALIHETGGIVQGSFAYDPAAAGWVKSLPQPVRCAYESGPTGFDLLRRLESAGVCCVVGAVTKMPRPCGDRIKNDERDAVFLARMLSVGNIVEVYVPGEADEAARDLARAREDVRQDLTRAKHLLSKLLLRKGIVYEGGKKARARAHRRWPGHLELPSPTERLVLSEYLVSVEEAERKRGRPGTAIGELAATERWRGPVSRLSLLRGVSTTTAFSVAAETGDFSRFRNAGASCSFLGLAPSLSESGESSSRGPITKTGNSHVRKLLVESAWHHRRRYLPSAQAPPDGTPPKVAQAAKKANLRLRDRAAHLASRKMSPCKANAAVAREAAGFVWALANMA
ncbi:MAG: IS110 family transposase [Coriobacteriales bacterium]|jgi:transposase|nr:IS110 family transposase [Coriobacteriales bacterium]